MSRLFSPIRLRELTIRNRIAMAPMCIYSAGEAGYAEDAHLAHYGARAWGGLGLIIIEATAVTSGGRNTVRDLGLWNDEQVPPLRRVVRFCQDQGAAVCIQLAHAGRKAWCNDYGVGPEPLVGPSAIPQGESWATPREMSKNDILEVVDAHADAARRALEVGADTVEIHAAHGYLIHQFLSLVANAREDDYGGSLDNRMRFLLEIVEAVRGVWPEESPLLVRVSATDWCEEGICVEDTVEIAKALKSSGVDLIDCSSGGILTDKPPRLGPGYQIPMADRIRREAEIKTLAVGSITTPELAEEVLLNGRADMIALGRELLRHPHWPLDAAHVLHEEIEWPSTLAAGQYD